MAFTYSATNAESLFEIKRVLYGKFNKNQQNRTDCFME